MKEIQCQVQSITSLTDHVYKVLLKPEQQIDFLPGQYLNFVMSDEDKRPFSIASSPDSELIELQIGAFGADSYPMQVVDRIKENKQVAIEIPLGKAALNTESDRPLILLAGGTGFSYIKSMFEYLANTNSEREVIVYWGLRESSACYELDKTAATINTLANGQFNPVIQHSDDNWQGKVGLVHQVVMEDIDALADYDIYIAGRFDMVAAVRDDFVAKGADINHMYADAFAFI